MKKKDQKEAIKKKEISIDSQAVSQDAPQVGSNDQELEKRADKEALNSKKELEKLGRKLVARYKKGSKDYLKLFRVVNMESALIITGDKKSQLFRLLLISEKGATRTKRAVRGITYDKFKEQCQND